MQRITDTVIENVFPTERNRLLVWLSEQKRHLRNWLILLLIGLGYVFIRNSEAVIPYIALNSQKVANYILFAWVLAIVITPFIWPQKRGDYFGENFKKGLDPRRWEYEDGYNVELDEDGGTVLTVADSDRGGLALRCLSWADYEVRFDTRIVEKTSGWIFRASTLNDYVHLKLGLEKVSVLYRITGIWVPLIDVTHGQDLELGKWYPIKAVAVGKWLSVFIKMRGRYRLAFQNDVLGVKEPVAVTLGSKDIKIPSALSQQVLTPTFRTGSFGFRLPKEDKAQFRNIKAYRLG